MGCLHSLLGQSGSHSLEARPPAQYRIGEPGKEGREGKAKGVEEWVRMGGVESEKVQWNMQWTSQRQCIASDTAFDEGNIHFSPPL